MNCSSPFHLVFICVGPGLQSFAEGTHSPSYVNKSILEAPGAYSTVCMLHTPCYVAFDLAHVHCDIVGTVLCLPTCQPDQEKIQERRVDKADTMYYLILHVLAAVGLSARAPRPGNYPPKPTYHYHKPSACSAAMQLIFAFSALLAIHCFGH
jgi:hypothetical protein